MLSAFQKELMTKLKPKVEEAGEKDGTSDEKETEEKDVEEKEEPQKSSSHSGSTPDPNVTAKDSENEGLGDKANDDQLFNFDAVVTNSRLSSQAARHKMGVVRNAKQRRQRPVRTRSVDSTVSKKLDVSAPKISLDDSSSDKSQDEKKKEPRSPTPPLVSKSVQEVEQKKFETEERGTKGRDEKKSVPQETKDTDEKKSVPRVTKDTEEKKSIPRETKDTEEKKSIPRVTKDTEEKKSIPRVTKDTEEKKSIPRVTKDTEEKKSIPRVTKDTEEKKSIPQETKDTEEKKSVPRVTKDTEEKKSVPRVTKDTEEKKSVPRETKSPEEVLKSSDANELKTCAQTHGETHAAIQAPSETAASRIFASAKTSISDVSSGSPIRPSKLEMTTSKQPKTFESPSPNSKKSSAPPLTKKSPITSNASSPGTKKSPTSPGNVSASPANKSQVESQISTEASPEGYSSSRRRSSIRDLARRFEVDDNGDSKTSSEIKPEEVSNTKRPGTKAANGDNAMTSGKPSVKATSPRKLSQPVFTSPPVKSSPQRKTSEPGIKKPIGTSTIATRINKLTERPAATEKPVETTRPRASTTSSINERANVFLEGTKSTTEVRKLSVNAGERPRTKVMDMMKKFET